MVVFVVVGRFERCVWLERSDEFSGEGERDGNT